MNRREFLSVAGIAIAAPYVLKFGRAIAQTPRVRRSLSTLRPDDPFFTQYGEAIRAMHRLPERDRRSWRGQATIHADFCPHGTDGFILWHRHYINFFERLCGSLIGNPNFALPYWDWPTNSGRLPAAFSEENNPLNVAFWRDRSEYREVRTVGSRTINSRRGLMDDAARNGAFQPRQMTAIMGQTNFSLFQRVLEGTPHNTAHTIIGGGSGHMNDMMSPLDPIFWLHHCNVDRLFAQWQRSGRRMPQQSAAYSGQFVDPNGGAQAVTATQALDFAALGFTYDVLGGPVVASRPQPQPPAPPAAPPAPPPAQPAPQPSAPQGRAESAPETAQRPPQQPGSNSYDGVIIEGRDGDRPRGGRPGRSEDFGIEIDGLSDGRGRSGGDDRGQPDQRQQDHAQHGAQSGQTVPAGVNIVGRSDNAQACATNRATRISVVTERAFNDILFGRDGSRLRSGGGGRAPGGDDGRILARLTVKQLQGQVRQCLVNVFVNAADVSPTTSADNPNYVGTFSFFGVHNAEQGGSFLVDVTEAVRGQAAAGRLPSGGGVDLQVLPVQASPDVPSETQFVVDGVEMISG
jgi:hypothetical protein